MFNFFKRNKKEVKKVDKSVYNGAIYRGVFNIGGTLVEGAYVRDGERTFVCDNGVANISRGVKISQIEKKAVSDNVEHYLNCLKNGYCTPFTFIK